MPVKLGKAIAIGALILLASAPAAWARRVGFANLAQDGAAGLAAIETLRAGVVAELGPDQVAPGPARDALEAPLTAADEADAAGLARAHQLMSDATAAFKSLEYDSAFDKLRQADSVLRGLTPLLDATAALAEVNLLLGQVQLGRKDEARALEAFRVARRLAPGLTALDPGKYRPQVVQLWDKAATPAEAGKTGVLVVTSEPPEAAVWVDGQPVGVTPLELPGVIAGEHYVGTFLAGHAPRMERVTIKADARVEQSVLLSRLPAEQRARSLRFALMRGTDLPLKRAAALLADVASVDVLVLVRQAEGGALEAAAWDVRTATLGAWVPIADGGKALVATVARAATTPIAVPRPDEVAKRVPDKRPGDGRDPKDGGVKQPSWYRTWWGTGLIIGGSVLLVGAVVAATSPDGEALPPSWTITDPRWSDGVK
jgi:hypothetical protein